VGSRPFASLRMNSLMGIESGGPKSLGQPRYLEVVRGMLRLLANSSLE
jgi:hypothetical protein